MSQRRTGRILTHAISTIVARICERESVNLEDFGKFEVKLRKGWIGRHPQSGQRVRIPDRYAVCFRPGRKLKRVIADRWAKKKK